MSLNTWSLILFFAQLLFYVGVATAVSGTANIRKLSFVVTAWLIQQAVTLWYGVATDQIGFILMFAFNFVVTFVGLVVSGKE